MKLGTEIIKQYKSQNDLQKQRELLRNVKPSSLKDVSKKNIANSKELKPTHAKENVNISKGARDIAKVMTQNDIATKAASLAKSALQTVKKPPEKPAVKKIQKEKRGPTIIKRPAIMFVGGFNWFGFGKGNNELKKMADYVPGANYFNHTDRDDIMQEIQKRPLGESVILIGQGLGGDTAVEIANELNTMKNGFRKINLLVTMDSVGTNNDIIPQNVKKNLNFISDGKGIMTDGPNIARNTKYTSVSNELLADDIFESKDVQFKLFESINDILADSSVQNRMAKNSIHSTSLLRENIRANL